MQYTIVDDNVEDAPIYRCAGKAPKPTRPHENHGLAMEHVPTQSESLQKPQSKSFAVPAQGSLVNLPKSRGHRNVHNHYGRLRFDTPDSLTDWNKQIRRNQNNS